VTALERKAAAKSVTVRDFVQRKGRGEKLVVVTAYDALFGRLVDEAGVDCVLVGDSLGNVIAGHDSTLPVTLAQMIYHAGMVRRGVSRALLVVDMPFLSYQAGADRAVLNCGRVVQRTRCNAVKMEGGNADLAEVVRRVVLAGIPVMGHVGFTPQSVNTIGGYRVQGKESDDAARLLDEARALEDAGAFSIVLELVPADVAARITEAVSVPTIGIGAGAGCDGQVLVLQDLLGLNDLFSPKFLKRYANLANDVRAAVSKFSEEVRGGRYPSREHEF
jgi:3-methyl-2-oxobutanoate hydroxymethyltransferase